MEMTAFEMTPFARKLQKNDDNNTKQHTETIYCLEGVHEFGCAGFQKPWTNNRWWWNVLLLFISLSIFFSSSLPAALTLSFESNTLAWQGSL